MWCYRLVFLLSLLSGSVHSNDLISIKLTVYNNYIIERSFFYQIRSYFFWQSPTFSVVEATVRGSHRTYGMLAVGITSGRHFAYVAYIF